MVRPLPHALLRVALLFIVSTRLASAQAAPSACTGDVTSRRALDSLTAIVRDSSPACLWLQLGRSRVAAADRGDLARPGPRQFLGTDYSHGAGNAFLRALEIDPTLLQAAHALVDVLAKQGRWPQEDDAVRALRRLNALLDAPPPWLLLARGRLEREGGERDSSAVLFKRALAAGCDSALGWLQLARELYYAGNIDEAHHAYLAGAQRIHSESDAKPYRESVALVASPPERAALDSTPVDSVGSFVTRFWARRDADAGRPDGDRLAEHYRRLEVAERSFRPIGLTSLIDPLLVGAGSSSSGPVGMMDSSESPLMALLDSSMLPKHVPIVNGYLLPGAVWLRQGPPDDFAGNFWKYDDAARWLVIEVGGQRFGGVCDIAVRYCPPPSPMEMALWHKEWQEMLDSSLATDAYPLRFEHQLAPVVNIYSLLASSGREGEALVVFAMRVSDLKARLVPGDSAAAAFPLEFRIIAYPPSGAGRFELDTTRWLTAPRSVGSDAWLTGTLTLPLPVGLYDARVVIEESSLRSPGASDSLPVDSRGAVVGRDSMIVAGAAGSLVMSDVIPGLERGGLSWKHGSETLALNPLSVWHRGEPIALQYELSGLKPGSQLRTQIRVMKGDDSTHAVTLSFTDDVRRTRQAFQRFVGTTRLSTGHYVVEVELETDEGQRITRRTRVEIR
jgi:tetratricopeptide (TPR) repeat protein